MTDFDKRAKDWDSDSQKVERARVVAEAIRGAIPLSTGMSALEYGCGTGLLSFELQPHIGQITLADTSSGMLDVLEQKISAAGVSNMHPLQIDPGMNHIPDRKFDLIYSLLTLHHIHDVEDVLRNFHSMMEPGGNLAIADLDKEDGSFHTDGTDDVHHGFSREKLKALVEKTGFRNIHFSTVYTIRKMISDTEKDFPVFLMLARRN
jgi:ubiquinone/menaquinone biosynthesis C-methylase UbiE